MKKPKSNTKPAEAPADNAAEFIPICTPEYSRIWNAIRDLHVDRVARKATAETKPTKISVWDRHYFPAYKRTDDTVFEKSEVLPTPGEIATIAATLAKNTKAAPDALTNTAMKLWLSARKRILMADYEFEIAWQDSELMECFAEMDDEFLSETGSKNYTNRLPHSALTQIK